MSAIPSKEVKPIDAEECAIWDKTWEIQEQFGHTLETGDWLAHSPIVTVGIWTVVRDWRARPMNPYLTGTKSYKAWQAGYNYAYDWMAEVDADEVLTHIDSQYAAAQNELEAEA